MKGCTSLNKYIEKKCGRLGSAHKFHLGMGNMCTNTTNSMGVSVKKPIKLNYQKVHDRHNKKHGGYLDQEASKFGHHQVKGIPTYGHIS